MNAIRTFWLAIAIAAPSAELWAQASDMDVPAAASDQFPTGISVRPVDGGKVYVDRRGLTLYGMDVRAVTGRTGQPLAFCSGVCLDIWEPLLAPAGSAATPVGGQEAGANASAADPGDWTIVKGPQGLQWAYKRVHLVFTHKGEQAGSTAHDGDDSYVWNTLKYVPPLPELKAPAGVGTRLVDGAYVLTDGQGNLLFSPRDKGCGTTCATWQVFAAGMARRGMGDWAVRQSEDRPQWAYRSKPVFRIKSSNPADIPAEGALLTP